MASLFCDPPLHDALQLVQVVHSLQLPKIIVLILFSNKQIFSCENNSEKYRYMFTTLGHSGLVHYIPFIMMFNCSFAVAKSSLLLLEHFRC